MFKVYTKRFSKDYARGFSDKSLRMLFYKKSKRYCDSDR